MQQHIQQYRLFLIITTILLIITIIQHKMSKSPSSSSSSQKNHHFLKQRGKILLLGDSITQMSFSSTLSGWGSYVADHYQRRCDIYNRGMSGYNTDWFIRYLDTEEGYNDVFGMMMKDNEQESNVKLVTIFFGANDASSKDLNPRHHVPISRFESNLKEIVKRCKKHFGPNVNIIFITPPPVCHKSRLEYQIQRYKDKATGELERTLSLSGEYADAVERVAKELKYPCLNIWKTMQEEGETIMMKKQRNNSPSNKEKESWSIFLSDGLHLSREGNLFVGKSLVKLIDDVYPGIAVTKCPFTDYTGNSASKGGIDLGSEGGIGPWHDKINHLDAGAAFFNSHEDF